MQDKGNPAKFYLKGYKALMLRRESLLREVERMRESLTSTTVQLKQDVVTSSGAHSRRARTRNTAAGRSRCAGRPRKP